MARPCSSAEVVLVVCLDLGVAAAFDQDLDRIGVISGASVYPFVWNVLLAARNEGFGGVLTTMAVAEEPAVKDLLGIPDEYAVAAVVPLGKPVKQVTKLTRKPGRHPRTFDDTAETVRSARRYCSSGVRPWRPSRFAPPSSASCTTAPSPATRASTTSATDMCVPALP